MKIIVVDDEELALRQLVLRLEDIVDKTEISSFVNPMEALSFVQKNSVDVAFLDIEMPGITGIELATKIREMNNDINVIFVTAYSEYAYEAMQIFASGYILKPARVADLEKQLNNLRAPIKDEDGKILKVQTFGNFEVFKNGKPVEFSRKRSKEIFAYLVDRKGAVVSARDLASLIFEDVPYDKGLSKRIAVYVSDLVKSFKNVDAQDVLIKSKSGISVDCEKIDCDYYRYIKGDTSIINSFNYEYMSQYSWSEFTLGALI